MSWLSDLGANLKKIVLMEHKIDQLGDEVRILRKDVLDHGTRLVRIETMIEMAQARAAASRPKVEDR